MRKLTDQELLAKIAKTDSSPGVRMTAVNILIDKKVLAEIAKEDSETKVRIAAAKKLWDEGGLIIEEREDDFRLLSWLLKHRGHRVRWIETAPGISLQGEWIIETPYIYVKEDKFEFTFRIPRDFKVEVYRSGQHYTEVKTTTTNLELPTDTCCDCHVDGLKVVYRSYYQNMGDFIKCIKKLSDASYTTTWEFELLES